jgi:DNA-binding CsgD family transcriptional regulator
VVTVPTAARARVERICAADADPYELRRSLVEELRRAVGFDAYAWILTDPETQVGCAPLADVPCLPELPELIRLRYLTPVNRWTGLVSPAAGLAAVTDGDLGRSRMWRDLLRHYDVTDVASVVFRDSHGCWAFLELWRVGRSAFGPDEVAWLCGVAPSVAAALRRAVARTLETTTPHEPLVGPLVLLLSPDLRIVRGTPPTTAALSLLVPRDDGLPPVPAGAYNVAGQLLAREAGVDASPPRARVHLSSGRWLTLSAARLQDERAPDDRDIAVTIESCTAADRLDLFARSWALSARERELLRHLAAGADTREVAALMNLSVHTVQDHLKSIFAKTGTHARRSLMTRALGR